jgi:hypothetical protein
LGWVAAWRQLLRLSTRDIVGSGSYGSGSLASGDEVGGGSSMHMCFFFPGGAQVSDLGAHMPPAVGWWSVEALGEGLLG